jgi:hypothetical protein
VDKIVRIGAASAFFNDSRMGIEQLLEKTDRLDYIIFDFLAESVMGGLGRSLANGSGPGFATDFVPGYVLPHLQTLLDRRVRIVANAGGLIPAACAESLRKGAEALGLRPRIGVVAGDNLTSRLGEFVGADTRDMFDSSPVADKIRTADRINSLVAYSGAFPIAAALAAGADIVITGRAVDSALALGALIHEFGWGPDDFDLLSAGTLAGHLLECTAQITGGTFTDWRDVPDWAGIGMPVGECSANGSLVITKPEGPAGSSRSARSPNNCSMKSAIRSVISCRMSLRTSRASRCRLLGRTASKSAVPAAWAVRRPTRQASLTIPVGARRR